MDKASRFGATLDADLDITSTTDDGGAGVNEKFLERVRLVRCFQRHAGGTGIKAQHGRCSQ